MGYKDKDKQREYQRNWKRAQVKRWRGEAIAILGGKCASCGIDDVRVLEFDHIEPELRKHLQWKNGQQNMRDVINGKTDNIQLLCANCHRVKTYEDRKKYANYKGE